MRAPGAHSAMSGAPRVPTDGMMKKMRLRWLGVATGLALLMAPLLVWQQQSVSCGARKLPPNKLHSVPSWPPPQPVRVRWEFPRPGSCDVTQLFGAYPIASRMLQRARVRDIHWEGAPFRRLVSRLEVGERIRVVVLGGSEAAGTGCDDGSTRLAGCSWSARFVRWLNRAYPYASIEYENHGAGGTTTAGILPSLRPILEGPERPPLDLCLIDFTANDAFEAQDWLAADGGAYANTEQEKMYARGHSRLEIVQAATSILLSRLQERHPQAALVLFETLCTVEGAIAKVDTAQCFDTQDAHVAAAKAFRVPVISYRDVVWPLAERQNPPKAQFWCCNHTSHPRWEAHQLMADVLAYAWQEIVSQACKDSASATSSALYQVSRPAPSLGSLVSHDLVQRYDQCRNAETTFDAKAIHAAGISPSIQRGTVGSLPEVVSGDWRLFEDRKGKPGWIAQELGATLGFDLTFGNSPRVIISFLRSYEKLGSVTIGFAADGADIHRLNTIVGAKYRIDGIWPQGTMPPGDGGRVSQVHSLALNVQQAQVQQRHGDAAMAGFGVRPNSQRRLLIQLERSEKFKILSVVSC